LIPCRFDASPPRIIFCGCVRWSREAIIRANANMRRDLERLRSEVYAVAESRPDFTSERLIEASLAFDAVAILLMKPKGLGDKR